MPGTILFGIDVETASEDSRGFLRYGSELFHELDCPVTLYVTGRTLETFPGEFREVEKDKLIELQAHTYDHTLLKTVLIKVPEGRVVHDATDWFYYPSPKFDEIEKDLVKCQKVFKEVLGREATALTGPWGYYRGLMDRPDLLELVDSLGFKVLRTFARDENDGNPVPLEWKPFFYTIQGYPHILECLVHQYQDDFYWEFFGDHSSGENYADFLVRTAARVAAEGLVWSMASHDHWCATREGFEKKGSWYRTLISRAKELGIRFQTVTQFYNDMLKSTD